MGTKLGPVGSTVRMGFQSKQLNEFFICHLCDLTHFPSMAIHTTVDPTGPSFVLALFKSVKNLILLNSIGMTSLCWEFFDSSKRDDMLFGGVLNDWLLSLESLIVFDVCK